MPATRAPLALAGLMLVVATGFAGEFPSVDGTWLSGDGDGWIEVRIVGDGLSGIITGSPNASAERPDTDEENPDPALRDRPLVGLEIFSGFAYAGDGRWKGGTIYDPNSGKTYRCIVTLVDADTLEVRGYVGIPLLGRTETWKRRRN
jgi:uncharacterized protein (DUF2147 family)